MVPDTFFSAACIREQFTLFFGDGGEFAPIAWHEAQERGPQPSPKTTGNLRPQRITDLRWAVRAPEGGAWFATASRPIARWLDDLLVELNPEKTPLVDRCWDSVGVTDWSGGGVWVITGDYHSGTSIFCRKADGQRPPPVVQLKKLEVKYGRRLCVTWELPTEGVGAVVWRIAANEPWRVLDRPYFEQLFTTPGKHEVRLEARIVDELGLLRPGPVHGIDVDVRLPRTRWTAKPPDCLEDLVWVVPVDAGWTDADVPRRIEWRVKGENWQVLPDNRRLPGGKYNNRAMEFEFRAVEEGIFIDPQPLYIKVAVEMSLEKVIPPRIERIISGTEAERKQAVEDLKAVPEEAKKFLRERLDLLSKAQETCRQALIQIEQAGKP